jgi:hypothetical protein
VQIGGALPEFIVFAGDGAGGDPSLFYGKFWGRQQLEMGGGFFTAHLDGYGLAQWMCF